MVKKHASARDVSRRWWLVRQAEDANTNAPVEPGRKPDSALRDAVKLRQAGLRARERRQ
jgi:hypothetical protein